MATSEQETQIQAASPVSYYFTRFRSLFSNIHLTIILLILIAAASGAGALFPQAPAGLEAYPAQYAQWLLDMRGKYGPIANVLFALGFFNLFNAWWFKLLLALLTLNVVICTLNRLPTIIRSVFVPKARLSDSFYFSPSFGRNNRVNRPFRQGAVEALASTLANLRYKVIIERDDTVTYLYADKFGWAKLGTLATHSAIAMALITVMVGGVMGFAEDGLVVPEGQTVEIGHGTGLSVRNDGFFVDYYGDKTPKDYRSALTVHEDGREVKRQVVRVNEPLGYNGVRLHQMGYGAIATIVVKDRQGELIQSTNMNMQPGKSVYYNGDFQVLGTDLVLAGLLPTGRPSSASTGNPGNEVTENEMTIFAVRGNTEIASYKLKVGNTWLIQDYMVTLADAREYTVLRVVKDPGSPMIWIASPLFVLGICLTLYLPRRRIWARIDSEEILITGAADRLVRLDKELDEIANAIR